MDNAMTFDAYQAATADTAIYPRDVALVYTALGLVGEAGEVAGAIKRILRDDGGTLTPARAAAIRDELGDVLWYVARLAAELGLSLDDVAGANLARRSAGTGQPPRQ
jgi:NTP pyrophosphatase (non-canonical NTP hydrolase)